LIDLLLQSALAYQKLLTLTYHVALGHKGVLTHMRIVFPENAYHHMAGFQYVGFTSLQNRSAALQTILSGKTTQRHFIEAGYVPNAKYDLADRWQSICHLQEMLENDMVTYYYRGHEPHWARIKADYVLCNPSQYFFIRNEEPVSVFGNRNQGYEKKCTRYTTLQVTRINIVTLESVTVYRSPSFKEPS